MSYRKLFLLIAFAPFVLLLLGGDARAQCFLDPDCDSDPWGFWGPGGGGSTISCKIGFGDTVLGGDPNAGTVTINSVPGNTFSCTRSDGTTATGQGQIVGGIQVTGVQAGQCVVDKSTKTSKKKFFSQCGQLGADVDGDIVITFSSVTSGTWSFGGVDALLNTGACNNSNLFPEKAPFLKNEIFTTTVTYNNTNCQGTGNDGKVNFRSCTGTALDTEPACIANDNVHTVSSSLDQIITFGLSCQRLPVNQTSCQTNTQGIIKATIDGTTTNTATIDQNSIRCGNPDDPFFSTPQSVTSNGNDLIVSCFRCFQKTYVPGPDNTLVVTANQADGSTISHIVGGLCAVAPVSG
jgi:hypothetical protein